MPAYRTNTSTQASTGRRPGSSSLASRLRDDFSPDPPSNLAGNRTLEDPRNDQEREEGQQIDEYLRDIIEVIKGNKQVQKCSPHAQELRTQARWIYRLLGPAVDLHTVFRYGPYCVDTDDELPDLPEYSQEFLEKLEDDDRAKLARQYLSLFDIIPALPELIDHFSSTEALWRQFLRHLSSHADAGRRDDIKNIKGGILLLMPRKSTVDVAQVDPQAEQTQHSQPLSEADPFSLINKIKEARGFNHLSTARLLCPRAMLNEFDADQLKFCSAVIEGRRSLEAGDFMTFLYGDEYVETCLERGLFRSSFLMRVFRFIFTGKTSATNSKPGPSTVGRPSLAVAAKRREVIPEMIAWAAVMAYYALCSQSTWSLQDGNVSLIELWDLIIGLFKNRESKWATETLQWWNLNVWGSWAVKLDARHQRRTHQTTAEKLAEQRAAQEASSST